MHAALLLSQLIQGKMERRLAEAEARGETAAVLAARAEQVQEQAHVAAVTAEAAVSWMWASLSFGWC